MGCTGCSTTVCTATFPADEAAAAGAGNMTARPWVATPIVRNVGGVNRMWAGPTRSEIMRRRVNRADLHVGFWASCNDWGRLHL